MKFLQYKNKKRGEVGRYVEFLNNKMFFFLLNDKMLLFQMHKKKKTDKMLKFKYRIC